MVDKAPDHQVFPGSWPENGEAVKPQTREQVGHYLVAARSQHKSIGSPGADHRWDWSHLNQVVAFEPKDMVLVVETGMTFGRVKDLVEENGLWLPLDLGKPGDPTIAEYLSRDLSLSWLSHRYRTATDWIVAAAAFDDQGQEVKWGARVVKNAAGYQLMPLYIGAWEALGPVVEVAFRLLPLPAEVTYAHWESPSSAPLMNIWQNSRRSDRSSCYREPWSALRLEHAEGLWTLVGLTPRLSAGARTWAEGESDVSQVAIESATRPPREEARATLSPNLRIQTLPSHIPALIEALEDSGAHLICYPAAGVVCVEVNSKNAATLEGHLEHLADEGAVISPLSPELSLRIPARARRPAEQNIMSHVKSILDPDGLFGPLPNNLW